MSKKSKFSQELSHVGEGVRSNLDKLFSYGGENIITGLGYLPEIPNFVLNGIGGHGWDTSGLQNVYNRHSERKKHLDDYFRENYEYEPTKADNIAVGAGSAAIGMLPGAVLGQASSETLNNAAGMYSAASRATSMFPHYVTGAPAWKNLLTHGVNSIGPRFLGHVASAPMYQPVYDDMFMQNMDSHSAGLANLVPGVNTARRATAMFDDLVKGRPVGTGDEELRQYNSHGGFNVNTLGMSYNPWLPMDSFDSYLEAKTRTPKAAPAYMAAPWLSELFGRTPAGKFGWGIAETLIPGVAEGVIDSADSNVNQDVRHANR